MGKSLTGGGGEDRRGEGRRVQRRCYRQKHHTDGSCCWNSSKNISSLYVWPGHVKNRQSGTERHWLIVKSVSLSLSLWPRLERQNSYGAFTALGSSKGHNRLRGTHSCVCLCVCVLVETNAIVILQVCLLSICFYIPLSTLETPANWIRWHVFASVSTFKTTLHSGEHVVLWGEFSPQRWKQDVASLQFCPISDTVINNLWQYRTFLGRIYIL